MRQFTQSSVRSVDDQAIAGHWNDRARAFSSPHPRLRLIAGMVAILPGDPLTLLDLGCGPATLETLLPSHIRYFGADVAGEVVPHATAPERLEVADLNTGEEPFPGRRFDVVVASGIFEYIRDPAAFMALLRRKVAPDGHLVLSYLNRQHHREVRRELRGGSYAYPDPHLNFITLAEAVRLLRTAGFTIHRTTAITAGQRAFAVPLVTHHFPLNVGARQFIFECRRGADRPEGC